MTDRKASAFVLPAASEISERCFVFLTGSGAMLAAGMAVPFPVLGKLFLGAAAGLFIMAALGLGFAVRDRVESVLIGASARRALGAETCPALVSDDNGRLLAANTAARRFAPVAGGVPLHEVLRGAFGAGIRAPDRLIAAAGREGHASETWHGGSRPVRVSVRRLDRGQLLWAFDERNGPDLGGDSADRVAIISAGVDGSILGGNTAALALLGALPATLADMVGEAEVLTGEMRDIRTSTGTINARLVEIRATPDWREIALLPEPEQTADRFLTGAGLLQALPVPMLKIAADGALIEANAEARAILSRETGPLPPLFELVEGMGRPIMDWLGDAINGRGLLKPEIVRAVGLGQELFLQITLGRAVENGETVLVGILNDATELKTLEAQFVQSQKMQAIGQLAGGVAHDFNNLLTAIGGHCDLLLLRHDQGDPDYADLIQISQNANRAASLVGQLLAFSRKQNLKPQALDLRDTMSDLAHLLNRLIGERVQLEVIHAPGPQVIRADRRQIEQVIVNLVVNARDAMPEGGRVTVTIGREDLAGELVRDRARVPAGDYVVIEVRDTGTGIPPEGIGKIFEPFYTTKKTGEGTGLGLSTAYGIVKQTGGYIFVDSSPGQGAVFSLYFPAHQAPAEPSVHAEPAKPATPPAERGGVILLVEDEAPVRAFAGRALRMRGYTVLEAENAEQALATLEDPGLKVDVFVTDVIMPGLDGPSWVRQAREERPETRTVFVSGYSEEGRAEQQARIPNSVFLPKPFSLHQLIQVVNEQFV